VPGISRPWKEMCANSRYMCGGKVQGTIATKLLNCIECDFFQSMHYDRSYKKNDTISHQSLFSRGGRDFLGNVYGTI